MNRGTWGLGVAAWIACSGALHAQIVPPDAPGSLSGQVERSLRRVEEPPVKAQVSDIEVSTPVVGKSSERARRVRVSRVFVTGNRALSLGEIRPALPGTGELALSELYDAAEKVTAVYRAKGYALAYAYLPEGDRSAGEVEIAVVEGWIDRILLTGNAHVSDEFILAHFVRLREPGPFRIEDLEREMLLVNEHRALEVRAYLKPGVSPGATDLHLEAEDQMPLTLAFDVDNFGAKAVGENRAGVTVGFHDLWGEGHALSLRGVAALDTTDGDLGFGRVEYMAPLGAGTRLTLWGAFYDYEAESDLTLLRPSGDGDAFGAAISHPFWRGTDFSLWGEVGVEVKSIRQELIGAEVAHDRLRLLVLGVRTEIVDGWDGRWVGSLRFIQGVGGFAGGLEEDDPEASRPLADGEFSMFQARIHRLQPVARWILLIGRIDAQAAGEPLVVSEQFVLGGHDSVRGYPPFEFMGDHGYTATVEARFRLPFLEDASDPLDLSAFDVFQVAAFLDTGETIRWNPANNERRDQALTGAGVGFRLDFPGSFHLRLDVAWPLTDIEPSTGDEVVLYLSVLMNIR